jgi:hypothetical protein
LCALLSTERFAFDDHGLQRVEVRYGRIKAAGFVERLSCVFGEAGFKRNLRAQGTSLCATPTHAHLEALPLSGGGVGAGRTGGSVLAGHRRR